MQAALPFATHPPHPHGQRVPLDGKEQCGRGDVVAGGKVPDALAIVQRASVIRQPLQGWRAAAADRSGCPRPSRRLRLRGGAGAAEGSDKCQTMRELAGVRTKELDSIRTKEGPCWYTPDQLL